MSHIVKFHIWPADAFHFADVFPMTGIISFPVTWDWAWIYSHSGHNCNFDLVASECVIGSEVKSHRHHFKQSLSDDSGIFSWLLLLVNSWPPQLISALMPMGGWLCVCTMQKSSVEVSVYVRVCVCSNLNAALSKWIDLIGLREHTSVLLDQLCVLKLPRGVCVCICVWLSFKLVNDMVFHFRANLPLCNCHVWPSMSFSHWRFSDLSVPSVHCVRQSD